jgi:hypothetical protein
VIFKKALFYIWLINPKTRGAKVIYNSVIKPLIMKKVSEDKPVDIQQTYKSSP